jgi:hypothetical protein
LAVVYLIAAIAVPVVTVWALLEVVRVIVGRGITVTVSALAFVAVQPAADLTYKEYIVVVFGFTTNVDDVCHVEPLKLYDAASLADAVRVDDAPLQYDAGLASSERIVGRS